MGDPKDPALQLLQERCFGSQNQITRTGTPLGQGPQERRQELRGALLAPLCSFCLSSASIALGTCPPDPALPQEQECSLVQAAGWPGGVQSAGGL